MHKENEEARADIRELAKMLDNKYEKELQWALMPTVQPEDLSPPLRSQRRRWWGLLHEDPAATSHHNQPSFVVHRECRRSRERHCLSLTPNFDSSASRSSSMTVAVRICNDQPRHYLFEDTGGTRVLLGKWWGVTIRRSCAGGTWRNKRRRFASIFWSSASLIQHTRMTLDGRARENMFKKDPDIIANVTAADAHRAEVVLPTKDSLLVAFGSSIREKGTAHTTFKHEIMWTAAVPMTEERRFYRLISSHWRCPTQANFADIYALITVILYDDELHRYVGLSRHYLRARQIVSLPSTTRFESKSFVNGGDSDEGDPVFSDCFDGQIFAGCSAYSRFSKLELYMTFLITKKLIILNEFSLNL